MDKLRKISVIIPAWNATKFLWRAVESLAATNYSNLEVVIVDDASTDNTWMVCNEIQKRFPALVRIFQRPMSEVRGAAASRNLGIKMSTGEYVAFLDADDWVYPWRFEESVNILNTDPRVDAVYGECDVVYDDSHDSDLPVNKIANGHASNEGVSFSEFTKNNLWHTSAILLRRSLLAKTGLFDKSFPIGQDSHLWYKVILVGVLHSVKDPRSLSAYFRHSKNRYHPGNCHDLGRHAVELISVWKWARGKGLWERADELYSVWRGTWAEHAILMARFHYFETCRKLVIGVMTGLSAREWFTIRLYKEIVRVVFSILRHGVGCWMHGKAKRA